MKKLLKSITCVLVSAATALSCTLTASAYKASAECSYRIVDGNCVQTAEAVDLVAEMNEAYSLLCAQADELIRLARGHYAVSKVVNAYRTFYVSAENAEGCFYDYCDLSLVLYGAYGTEKYEAMYTDSQELYDKLTALTEQTGREVALCGFAPYIKAELGLEISAEKVDVYANIKSMDEELQQLSNDDFYEMYENSRTDFYGSIKKYMEKYSQLYAKYFRELQRIADMHGCDNYLEYALRTTIAKDLTVDDILDIIGFNAKAYSGMSDVLQYIYVYYLWDDELLPDMSFEQVCTLTGELLTEMNPEEKGIIDWMNRNKQFYPIDGSRVYAGISNFKQLLAFPESAEGILSNDVNDSDTIMRIRIAPYSTNVIVTSYAAHELGHAYSYYTIPSEYYCNTAFQEVMSTANVALLSSYARESSEYSQEWRECFSSHLDITNYAALMQDVLGTDVFTSCIMLGGEITPDDIIDILYERGMKYGAYRDDVPQREQRIVMAFRCTEGCVGRMGRTEYIGSLDYSVCVPLLMYIAQLSREDFDAALKLYNECASGSDTLMGELTEGIVSDDELAQNINKELCRLADYYVGAQ